jgi:hypothetical protein
MRGVRALLPAARRWVWFVGLWAASVTALAVAAGLLKLVFSAIFRA